MLQLSLPSGSRGGLEIRSTDWKDLVLTGLRPSVILDGVELAAAGVEVAEGQGLRSVEYRFARGVRLFLTFEASAAEPGVIAIRPRLELPPAGGILNRLGILSVRGGEGVASFGSDPARVRVLLEQGYDARVVPLLALRQAASEAGGEPNTEQRSRGGSSSPYWLAYDRAAGQAFLVGCLSAERWIGRVDLSVASTGNVESWELWLDGGDTLLPGGREIPLEDIRLAVGPDPWRLLEEYAEAVRDRAHPPLLATPPVSWCSWYPYRLSVSEERVLANARVATRRLKPLGLSIMEVDLGWETEYLPSSFVENSQFPHGLRWLSERLFELGFALGAWKAPFTVSEFDPVVREHPEWLIAGADGKPASYGTWFWRPHGDVYILDLTHPGAREHLRSRIESLRERGVRYFKPDFIGCAANDLAKRRHDPTIVAGGGTEAARMGGRIIREALGDALVLNCGGPELPGTGSFPLLYTCNDTGNTGYITGSFQRSNYQALATHLFKNRRWGTLQPSCLCVGLPGGLEEARLRATAAFLTGGQIDISDDLTSLPEDRWQVLEATLPPTGITARPVDLFEAVTEVSAADYVASAQGKEGKAVEVRELPPASVWHARVERDWDAWDLVAMFAWSGGDVWSKPALSSFSVPLRMLGHAPTEAIVGYEFWSGQYLGAVPSRRRNPPNTDHPGDVQELLSGEEPGKMELAFCGPAAKLICLRLARAHPWVAGTSFHQSCGWELEGVRWDEGRRTLSGVLRRPAGSVGTITLSTAGLQVVAAEADGRPLTPRPSARGSITLALQAATDETYWWVRFGAPQA